MCGIREFLFWSRSYCQLHGGRPSQRLLDERIVGIPSSHPLRPRDVVDGHHLPVDLHHHVCHVVHAHPLVTPNVQRLHEVGLGQPEKK